MRLGFLWGILSGGVVVAALGWLVVAWTEPSEPPQSAVVRQPAGDVVATAEPQGQAEGADEGRPPADKPEATPGADATSGERSVPSGEGGPTGTEQGTTATPRPTTAPADAIAAPEAAPAENAAGTPSQAPLDDTAMASAEASAGGATRAPDGQPTGAEVSGPLATVTPTETVDTGLEASGAERGGAEAAPEQTVDPLAPRFDVVRVDARGQTVIAGHAQPGQAVEILLDGDVVQSVRADASGNFVAVVTAALGDGARQLQLRVTVPESGTAAAVSEADAAGAPPAEGEPDAGPSQPGVAVAEAGRTADSAEGSAAPEASPAPAQPAELAAPPPASGAPVPPPGPAQDTVPVPDTAAGLRPRAEQAANAASSVEDLREPDDAAAPAPDAPTEAGEGVVALEPGIGAGSQIASTTPEAGPTLPATGPVGPGQAHGGTADATARTESPAGATAPNGAAAETAPGEIAVAAATPEDGAGGPNEAGAGTLGTTAPDGAPDSDSDTTASAPAAPADPSPARDPSTAAPDAAATAEPASGPPASDADAPEPGLRYVLSAPVLILPAQEGDGAPALVRPGGEELALLQPGESSDRPARGVVLDQITYDPDGDLLVRGRAADRHAVRIYGNGRLLDTVPVRKGTWRVSLARDRVADLSLFRFDEIDPAGQVTSRIEAPFRYTGERPQVLRDREIVIQRGDNLWRIAEQVYGEGLRYSVIYGANSELIRDPDLIYPDQVFTIPELVEAE